MFALFGHGLMSLALGGLVLASYRWIRRRSEAVGTIVGLAILVRLTLGLGMFWISYLGLPIAQSLQVEGGFWRIALDATGYYQMAVHAAEAGRLYPLDHAVPSPLFINALALWMMAVGISPVAGMFLNLCLYVLLAVMVLRAFAPVNNWRQDLPCIVGIGAYSFSPIVLLNSTQPLKDELCMLFVAIACLSALTLRHLTQGTLTRQHAWHVVVGTLGLTVAIFGVAGIRWYSGVITWGSLALVLTIFAVQGRTRPLPRYLAGAFLVLVVTWLGFWGASGPYYRQVGANLNRLSLAAIPSDLVNVTQMQRTGFLMSGGQSNIVVPLREDADTGRLREIQLTKAYKESAAYQELLARNKREAEMAPVEVEEVEVDGEPSTMASGTNEGPARRTSKPTAKPTAKPLVRPTPAAPPPITDAQQIANWKAQAEAARAIPVTMGDHLRIVAVGQAILFLPMSLLKSKSGVRIATDGGFLYLADLDTVFLDATVLLVLGLLWTRRRAIGDRMPFIVFSLVLAAVTAVLMGYVVTNFGTLWRMRPLVAVPIWLLVTALGSQKGISIASPNANQRPPTSAAS